MSWNLARPCRRVALTIVKLCNAPLQLFAKRRDRAASASLRCCRVAKMLSRCEDAVALRRFCAACMKEEAVEDDSPLDEATFAFGSFRLIPAQRMLLEDGKPLRLGNRDLDVLVALVDNDGATIHKDQLIARTWPDTVVDEGALRVHVAALRKALGDGRGVNRFIANIPGRG